MRSRRARGRLPRGRGPGTPRGRRGIARHLPGALIAAGAAISVVAFTFCVIASAYGWHRAVTGPGIVVSLAVMVACVLAARLRGDGR